MDNLEAYAERCIPDMNEEAGQRVRSLLGEREIARKQGASAREEIRRQRVAFKEVIQQADARTVEIEAELMRVLPANPIAPQRIGQ